MKSKIGDASMKKDLPQNSLTFTAPGNKRYDRGVCLLSEIFVICDGVIRALGDIAALVNEMRSK